jgi:hypothetical protein
VIQETNEANNGCSDTVVVTAPDLTAVKANDVNGTAVLGGHWTWSIKVANTGNGDATFTDGKTSSPTTCRARTSATARPRSRARPGSRAQQVLAAQSRAPTRLRAWPRAVRSRWPAELARSMSRLRRHRTL